MGIRHEKCTRFEQLSEIREQWDDLLMKSDADRLFMSFDWIEAWWECFGNRYALLTYLLYKEDELIGILPLLSRTKEGLREIALLGVGTSDYLDFILHPKHVERCVRFFFQEILSHAGKWDVFHCTRLIEDKATLLGLTQYIEPNGNFRCLVREFSVAPFININQTWQSYLGTLKTKILSDTRRQLRRLEAKSKGIRYKKIDSLEEFVKFFDKLVEFHKVRRDKFKGDYSMFNQGSIIEFYKRVSLKLLANHKLHMSLIACGDELLALHLGFAAEGKFYYLVPVINWEYEKFSVGRILLLHLLEEAFAEHYREFDFCYGNEAYKYDFTSCRRTMKEIVIANNTLKGNLAILWFKSLRHHLKENSFIMHGLLPKLRSIGIIREAS
jgi:CelD/BcsL family acetyltransferase involved in cellulose biosynthesis